MRQLMILVFLLSDYLHMTEKSFAAAFRNKNKFTVSAGFPLLTTTEDDINDLNMAVGKATLPFLGETGQLT